MLEVPPPAELEPWTSRIGAEATLKLIERHGGTRLYIPKAPNQGCALAREIGLEAALTLAASWGGDWLRVPLARNWRVRLYRARGDSYPTIARKLGLTEKAVWGHLNAASMTRRQLDLFSPS
ncbi:hypothetical protein GCM10010964_33470 [Caldovatus sediminis]|uniref:Mor transcription activator domain-containing protein n=1 Tax=Caldovatus sediminis TaxID=2041189 RepID=A0A8J3EDJ4_9PROT|nr:hypothetical protein [Caldovatus sediminis]GGG43362.1 hypothetical protein GCM10010964_33470 [Caldovatus sediminis]